MLSIDTDGDIYPCHRFVKDGKDKTWVIGDINKGFNDKLRKYINTKKIIHDKCINCSHERRCRQNCTAINYTQNRDIENRNPLTTLSTKNLETLTTTASHFLLGHYKVIKAFM